MKNSNNQRIRSSIMMMLLLTMFAGVTVSCSRIYDNIEKYAADELIYADGLDGIVRVQVGYERVEIDLMNAGRIPSSRIVMKRAKKTVIECADFDEPDHRRVIDSVCSWVNVTGLTQLKTYQITIYTEDAYGNRSLPLEVDVVPYTNENLDALVLVPPSIIESTSAALVEWKERISAVTHTVYRYAYSYSDKDGIMHTGGENSDMPSFLVENVEKEKNIPITITCRIIPRIMENNDYIPILDSVDWQTTLGIRISENAEAAIFLKTPVAVIDIDINQADATFPLTFSWSRVSEVNGYTLKISDDPDFPTATTYTVNVGDAGEYLMDLTEGLALINFFPNMRQMNLYWTVTPVDQSVPVRNQVRRITVSRLPYLIGRWLFDNEANLAAAMTGQDLIPVGGGFTSVAGPSPTNKAVRVAQGSYYRCLHGLPDGTNDYTIMLHVKNLVMANYGLIQMNPDNTDNAELIWSASGLPGIDGIGNPTNHYCLGLGQWHQIAMVVNGNAKSIYIDGELAYGGTSTNTRYLLNHEGILFFTGGTDNDIDVAEIAIWNMALTQDEIHEASGLQKLDRTQWSIPNYSAGSGISNLIDNIVTTYWSNSTEPPHYAVIDLGAQKNIGKIILVGSNQGASMVRSMQLLVGVSNVLIGSTGWTQVGEMVREAQAPNSAGGNFFTWDFSETPVTGRFLQIYLPDRWSGNTNLNLNDVYVYEKVSD